MNWKTFFQDTGATASKKFAPVKKSWKKDQSKKKRDRPRVEIEYEIETEPQERLRV